MNFAVENEHGVYEENQCEVVRGCEGQPFTRDGWEVQIFIAQIGEDDWRAAPCLVRAGNNGAGMPLTQRAHKCASRTVALLDGVETALRIIEGWEKRDACKVYGAVRKWLREHRQLTLF